MTLLRGRERPPPPACPTAGRRPGSRKWWTATCSSCGENRGEEGYGRIALRLATGEVFRPDLEDGGQRVTIAAVIPQGYLVRLAGIPAAGSEMQLSHYAVMDKADYWNARPNYREFTDPSYEAYSFDG